MTTATNRRRNRSARSPGLWGAAVLAVVVLAVAVPVGAVLLRSVQSSPGWSTSGGSAWQRILGDARTWRIVALTVGQAAASALGTVALGVPLAYVLSRYAFPGRSILRAVVTVPFVLPSVVVGAAFGALYGGRGVIDARGSWWLIIAAHVCFNLAVMIRSVGAAFARVGADTEAAARVLGRRGAATFREVLLPQVAPAIAAASAITFLFCLTSFGVIVMLGGGPVTTIEVEIWTRATRQFDLSGAAVLSAVQLVAVAATLGADLIVSRRAGVRIQGSSGRLRAPRYVAEWSMVSGAAVAIVVISGLPLLALVLRSLQTPGGWGLSNWTGMGSVLVGTQMQLSPLDAILNSLLFAAEATVVTVLLALPTSRFLAREPTGVAKSLVLVPLGISATTTGLGLLIAFGRPPIDLRASGWLIPAAQLLIALPLVTRILVPPTESLNPSVLDAASLLGNTPRQRLWRVELPLLRSAIAAAAGLGFVACLGEFGATVFVTRSDRTTMPVLLQRLMSRPGGVGYGQAMALAVVMVVICAAVLAAADRLVERRSGELSIL